MAIGELPEELFLTDYLRNHIQVNNGSMFKALKNLEVEGMIERVSSFRPYRCRRHSKPRPDFTLTFMEAQGLTVPASAISVQGIPLLAN